MAAAQQQTMLSNPNLAYLFPDKDSCEGYKRFECLWPAFIDSELSLPQGRRIAKEHACTNPLIQEMSEVCQHLQLPHAFEPYKVYARQPENPGRIRVKFLNSEGEPINEEVRNKRALMLKMGELIPKLNSRHQRLQRARLEEAQAAREAEAKQQQATQRGKDSKPAKKKKKKGKR